MEPPLLFGRPLDFVFINEEDKVKKKAKGTNSLIKSHARRYSHAQKVKKEGASCRVRGRDGKVMKRVLKKKDESQTQVEKSKLIVDDVSRPCFL
jgi:gas vesicle protein